MMAKKGFSEEQIAKRFNLFKEKYQQLYPEDLWEYIEENFWLYVFQTCAPDVLMQVYTEMGLVHENGDFYAAHISKIKERFNIGCNIIDIGSGIIPSFANKLAYEQLKINKGTITIYEPLLVDAKAKYPNMTIHKEDFTQIEKNCDCYACQNFTKSYIRHLINVNETFGQRLLSIHNIRFLIKITEEIKETIKNNNFDKYKKEFIEKYKNK